MRPLLVWTLLAALVLAAGFTWLTRPNPLRPGSLPEHTAHPANGELVFHAGGCGSCHGERLEGGLELTLRLHNLSDERYQEVAGYPAPGRRLTGGLRWRLFQR